MKPGSDYESLDSYFSRLRDKVENAEQYYPRLTSVVKGETTLVDIVNDYETRFYQLVNHKTVLLNGLKIKKLQNDVTEYVSDLSNFSKVLRDISVSSRFDFDNYLVTDYKKMLKKDMEFATWSGVALGSIAAFLIALAIPPLAPLALVGMGGLIGSLFGLEGADDISYKSAESKTKSFFKELHDYAESMDKEVRSAYVIEYFKTNPDLFRETYRQNDSLYRNYIKTKLAQMQEFGLFDMRASNLETLLIEIEKEN